MRRDAFEELPDIDNPYQGHPIEPLEKVIEWLGEGDAERASILNVLLAAARFGDQSAFGVAAMVLISYAEEHPYFDLADYMHRTWVRAKEPGMRYCARVHLIRRSDHDRALHDHPWANASLVLSNGYWEVTPGLFQAAIEHAQNGRCSGEINPATITPMLASEVITLNEQIQSRTGNELDATTLARLEALGVFWRAPMTFTVRSSQTLHRLVIPRGTEAWSLFVMRPKVREWGFLGTNGWVHNVEYTRDLGRDA